MKPNQTKKTVTGRKTVFFLQSRNTSPGFSFNGPTWAIHPRFKLISSRGMCLAGPWTAHCGTEDGAILVVFTHWTWKSYHPNVTGPPQWWDGCLGDNHGSYFSSPPSACYVRGCRVSPPRQRRGDENRWQKRAHARSTGRGVVKSRQPHTLMVWIISSQVAFLKPRPCPLCSQ